MVVSGDPDAVDDLVPTLHRRGARARGSTWTTPRTPPQVELIEQRLLDVLAGITPRASRVPFYSTVTGGGCSTPPGWTRGTGTRTCARRCGSRRPPGSCSPTGIRVFLEGSPHPVLTMGIEETAADGGVEVAAVGSLRRGEGVCDGG